MSSMQKYRLPVILGAGLLIVFFFIQGSLPSLPPSLDPTGTDTKGGMKVCFKNQDGTVSCEEVAGTTFSILPIPQVIVSPEGKQYASFHPFIRVSSNRDGQFTLAYDISVKVLGNDKSARPLSLNIIIRSLTEQKTLQANIPLSLIDLAVNADDIERVMDEYGITNATLFMSYTLNVREAQTVISGSASVRGIGKLIVQADVGIGGGTTSATSTSTTTSTTTDFQLTNCTIPYYYYSSSGVPRTCSSISSVTVQPDKTVRVAINVNVADDPHTYGRAGGDIQMRVLDSSGNLMYAGQCLGSFCYIAGSKDYPTYAASSGVLIGENRGYSFSTSDTLAPRRVGGNAEIIIFDKGTYSILLIEGGVQVSKRQFVVG